MATAQVFGKICQSRLQKSLPARYILPTTAKLREGTLSPWPTSRDRTRRASIAKRGNELVSRQLSTATDIRILYCEPKSK
jgi:hypothetical protein